MDVSGLQPMTDANMISLNYPGIFALAVALRGYAHPDAHADAAAREALWREIGESPTAARAALVSLLETK